MKKIVVFITIFFSSVIIVNASSNVTGYKDKYSPKISSCNGKYYGFHKNNDIYHYHMVKWNDETSTWQIEDDTSSFDDNPCGDNTSKAAVSLSSCVDGDTAKLVDGTSIITVRFLAVDTPETVHPTKEVQAFGKEASSFTCNELTNAKKIEIEFDSGSDKYDKYNRYLVWLYVDNELIQSKLVSNGYARVYYIYGNYKYTDDLYKLQLIAEQKKIGIWSLSEYQSSMIGTNSKIDNDENIISYLFVILLIILISLIKKNKTINKYFKLS